MTLKSSPIDCRFIWKWNERGICWSRKWKSLRFHGWWKFFDWFSVLMQGIKFDLSPAVGDVDNDGVNEVVFWIT